MHRRGQLLFAVAMLIAVVPIAFAIMLSLPRSTAAGVQPAVLQKGALRVRAVSTADSLQQAISPEYGLLDGVRLTDEQRRGRAATLPVAVMIDNWTAARPQSGLDQAEIVYEALVEGGITRLMALYWRNDADTIGPVRSARTQFLLPALEWDAVYSHVGAAEEEGPANATAQFGAWGVRHVDEGDADGVIRRNPNRVAPHNAVTSTDALHDYAASRGWIGAPALTPWSFKADGGASGRPAQSVALEFDRSGGQAGAFAVRWQYDPAENRYLRFQAGAPHVDGHGGDQLAAKNVIIQFAVLRSAGDRSGHVLYDLEGSGRATVLLDGQAVDATWRKEGRAARTRFYDAAGREIALNRGATWIELLPEGQSLTIR